MWIMRYIGQKAHVRPAPGVDDAPAESGHRFLRPQPGRPSGDARHYRRRTSSTSCSPPGLVTILGDLLDPRLRGLHHAQAAAPALTRYCSRGAPAVSWSSPPFCSGARWRKATDGIRVAIARINAYLQERIVGITVLHLFNREKKSCEEFDRSTAQHMLAFKGHDRGCTAGSTRWWSSCRRWRWRRFWPMADGAWKARRHHDRRGRGVRSVRHALLPADSGPQREVQHSCSPPWHHPNASSNCWTAKSRSPRRARAHQRLARCVGAESDSIASGSPTKTKDWVLRDVSFRIDPGETVAVVGHTGAGKTTLISLLLRFYDIQKGSIRVGGVDIRQVDPLDAAASLRRGAAGSLPVHRQHRGRISGWGPTAITREEIVAAAEQVNLMDFIRSLPDGFAQSIRERGSSLIHGPEAAHQFRARAGAQSALSDPRRSDVQAWIRKPSCACRDALANMVEGRTSHRDRAPPLHDPARRPDSGDAQGASFANRARIRSCWRCGAFTGSFISFSTGIRSCGRSNDRVIEWWGEDGRLLM